MQQSLHPNLVHGVRFGRSKSFPHFAKELCNSLCKGFLPPGLIIVILFPTSAHTEHVLSTLLIITGLYPWFMGVWGTIWLINRRVSDVIAGQIECSKRAFTRSTIKSLCPALCGQPGIAKKKSYSSWWQSYQLENRIVASKYVYGLLKNFKA